MEHTQELGTAKIGRLLAKFSIPAIIGMLVNSLYNVVDRIFVGNSAGTLGLAGISIGFPLMLIIIAFILLIGIGATALVSIKLGEGHKDEAEKIMGNTVTLLVIVSSLITVLGLTFLEPILKFFGASSDVLPYAKDYMQIILCGTVIQSLGFGLNNFIRAEGNPKIAMVTMIMGAILNAIFCPIFIYVLSMGIKGSALATVLAQSISSLFVIRYFLSGKSHLKIRRKNLKLEKELVRKIVSLGLAQFFMELSTGLVMVILNISLARYGSDIAISGMGIVTSMQTLVIMPLIGINQGAQPIIGYNYGAKQYHRVKETLKLAALWATIISLLGFFLVETFPREIVSMFNSNDPALIDFTVYALRVFLMMLPLVGFQTVGASYYMATGKPKQSAILTLSRQVLLLIPAVAILPIFLNLHGVIIAGPVADFGAAVLTGFWLAKELHQLERNHQFNQDQQLQASN